MATVSYDHASRIYPGSTTPAVDQLNLEIKDSEFLVLVTHDQVEAMTMGHRVAVLKDGLLQQCDTPRELYDRPGNVFVAGFIGSPAMNIKTVPLVTGGAQLGPTVVPLRRDQIAAAGAGGATEVTVGFRPEAVTVTADGTGLPVQVDLVEELGSDAYVYGHADITGEDTRIVTRTGGHRTPGLGDTIHLQINEEDVHVFHATTGARLN